MRRMAKGEGKLGCIFWGLLVGIVAIGAFEVVPVQVAKMKFEDQIKEVALTQPRIKARTFENQIFNMAQELDLPVERRDIKVKKSDKRVIVDVQMLVVLDLKVTDYDWNIKIHIDRDVFLF